MTANADVTIRSEEASIPDTGEVRKRRRFGWKTSATLALVLGLLLAFNGWWFWRESEAVTSLSTISTWVRSERYDQAEKALKERLRRAPHDAESQVMLAKVFAARGNLLGCARQLHTVPFWFPKKPEALYREGNAYFMIDRAKDAEAAWLAVIKDDPLHPVPSDIFHDAVFELLKLYATEDRWEDAYPVIWRAYDEATPTDHQVLLMWRMRSELERVAPSESIVLLKRYVAASPDDWEALRALARAEQALGQHAEADRHFQECLKGHPDDARAWRDYLKMLYDQGDRERWLATLARAPKDTESEPEIWKFRGLAKELADDLTGAAADYRVAIERNPNVVEYHHRLATVEERLGHTEEVVNHRKRSQELREASRALSSAYGVYLDGYYQRGSSDAKISTSMERLASICRTLGYLRAADAWEELAESSRRAEVRK